MHKSAVHLSGSSPLARGLLEFADLSQERRRIIPARAGFTICISSVVPTTPDHPRSRGVYKCAVITLLLKSGSSPLARGLHLRIVGIPTNP